MNPHSIRSLMKPKLEDEILKSIGDLSPEELLNQSLINNFAEGVKIALKKDVNPSQNNNWMIGYAIEHGYTEIVKLLLTNSKINPSIYDNFGIKYALKNGYTEIFKLLLQDKRVREKLTNEEIKKYENQMSGLKESHILKFDDIQNLEFRKGSLQYGDKVKQLIEFLRIYKDQNEDTLIFNKDDFEKASRMKISEIEEINNLPSKKSLMDFNIEITDDQIKFTDLQNRKSIHTESFDPSIRTNYEILGVEDFYSKIGGEYKNPHIEDIEKCIKKCIGFDFDEFNRTLDLASGTGEITKILMELGYNNIDIIGCDPYLYREYTMNTNKVCLKYSFSDIQQGELDNYKFDTIICSYGMHLADDSILPDMLWRLSMISKFLIIISPNNRPEIKEENGWILDKYFKIGKSKCKIYISKNL